MPQDTTNQVATNSTAVSYTSQNYGSIEMAVGVSVIIFPIVLVLFINAYRNYRSAVRRDKIAYLEKVWRLSITKKNV